MTRPIPRPAIPFVALLGALTFGCPSGGVGDPCTPEDEYQQGFNGFNEKEVNVESKSFQCETRVCIVNHFRGRVSCPYGQTQEVVDANAPPTAPERCRVPGTNGTHCLDAGGFPTPCPGAMNIDSINVAVQPQLIARAAENTVYCSCRCKGPDPNANYCECPSGYECSELVKELGLPGRAQLAGSYCIKQGTAYDPKGAFPDRCNAELARLEDGQNRQLCSTTGCKDVGANPGAESCFE